MLAGCIAVSVGAAGEVHVDVAASLPFEVDSACYGSDGNIMVMAGGHGNPE